jgi:hypothetical protein
MFSTSSVIATAITPSEKASSRLVLTPADFGAAGRAPVSQIASKNLVTSAPNLPIAPQGFRRMADSHLG